MQAPRFLHTLLTSSLPVVHAKRLQALLDRVGALLGERRLGLTAVMEAWQKEQNAQAITMLADGNADFTRALGQERDATAAGMGLHCKRFALIANDGVVEYLGIDEKGIEASSGETVLEVQGAVSQYGLGLSRRLSGRAGQSRLS